MQWSGNWVAAEKSVERSVKVSNFELQIWPGWKRPKSGGGGDLGF